jgi:hypothetical protein
VLVSGLIIPSTKFDEPPASAIAFKFDIQIKNLAQCALTQ